MPGPPEETKSALRARLKAGIADALRPDSGPLVTLLAALPELAAARTVLTFLPLPDEPDLTPLLEQLLTTHRLALPRIDWPAQRMWGVLVSDLVADVETTRHGVRQPRPGPALDPADIDAVLVPGLAFDESLARLGRGGGFYDRFLATLPAGATRIGVAFESRILARLPREAHDVPMDIVVTERRVLRR
ncbi:MAG: 5-formyltetrahydrofolate cyclo-ligase [Phycisphaerales bacterium]|nr:5-formyltetrahydrofolate cyclo-ligase [Phycisphaerales bacterium]